MSETRLQPFSYDAALDLLFGRIDYERAALVPYCRREYRLDRMRELLHRVGNPQRTYPIVHIAGTKGKGSTAAMIAGVLTAAGFRAGLYSSPHLDRVEERVAVDAQSCSAAELVELFGCVWPVVEAMDRQAALGEGPGRPTYFEITTAMALVQFARREVDFAVLEVGMGGRLDSTNVCDTIVSVITSISFDHTKQLGNTLESIAREKAGIIKPGVPVISGVVDEEPRAVIAARAVEHGCRLGQLGLDFDFDYTPPRDLQIGDTYGQISFLPHSPEYEPPYSGLDLRLLGRHQASNAAVAIATIAELRRQGWSISEAAIRSGLLNVHWPARVEVVARRPTVIIDAAHNVASIASLLTTLDESFNAERRWLIFATTQEKPIREMLGQMLPRFDGVVLTRYFNNPRYVPIDELDAIAKGLTSLCNGKNSGGAGVGDLPRLYRCDTPAEAWQTVKRLASPHDLVCVTGSFFLAAEVRQAIRADDASSPLASHA